MNPPGWTDVFQCSTDYEAELVCSRLRDASIPVVILNHRDHAFNLTHGYLAKVRVMVPKTHEEQARNVLEASPVEAEELARQALDQSADNSG